jgi:hypothetical protein
VLAHPNGLVAEPFTSLCRERLLLVGRQVAEGQIGELKLIDVRPPFAPGPILRGA